MAWVMFYHRVAVHPQLLCKWWICGQAAVKAGLCFQGTGLREFIFSTWWKRVGCIAENGYALEICTLPLSLMATGLFHWHYKEQWQTPAPLIAFAGISISVAFLNYIVYSCLGPRLCLCCQLLILHYTYCFYFSSSHSYFMTKSLFFWFSSCLLFESPFYAHYGPVSHHP